MNNETTLRDWLAMNAPWEDVPREDLTKGEKMGCLDKCFEDEARLRYRWADAVLRVRAETMPKVEPLFATPEETKALAEAILDSGNVVVIGDGCSTRSRDTWILQNIICKHVPPTGATR